MAADDGTRWTFQSLREGVACLEALLSEGKLCNTPFASNSHTRELFDVSTLHIREECDSASSETEQLKMQQRLAQRPQDVATPGSGVRSLFPFLVSHSDLNWTSNCTRLNDILREWNLSLEEPLMVLSQTAVTTSAFASSQGKRMALTTRLWYALQGGDLISSESDDNGTVVSQSDRSDEEDKDDETARRSDRADENTNATACSYYVSSTTFQRPVSITPSRWPTPVRRNEGSPKRTWQDYSEGGPYPITVKESIHTTQLDEKKHLDQVQWVSPREAARDAENLMKRRSSPAQRQVSSVHNRSEKNGTPLPVLLAPPLRPRRHAFNKKSCSTVASGGQAFEYNPNALRSQIDALTRLHRLGSVFLTENPRTLVLLLRGLPHMTTANRLLTVRLVELLARIPSADVLSPTSRPLFSLFLQDPIYLQLIVDYLHPADSVACTACLLLEVIGAAHRLAEFQKTRVTPLPPAPRNTPDVQCGAIDTVMRILMVHFPTLRRLIHMSSSGSFHLRSISLAVTRSLILAAGELAHEVIAQNEYALLDLYDDYLLEQDHDAVLLMQCLRTLFDILSEHTLLKAMLHYIADAKRLKRILDYFLNGMTIGVVYESFHILKLFICNPKMPATVQNLLSCHREDLLLQLQMLGRHFANDVEFNADRAILIEKLSQTCPSKCFYHN